MSLNYSMAHCCYLISDIAFLLQEGKVRLVACGLPLKNIKGHGFALLFHMRGCVTLNCSKANKNVCRLDLFGA